MSEHIADAVVVKRGHYGRLLVARIKPNQDLAESLVVLCRANGFHNAVVRGVVGSLIDGNLARGQDDSEQIVHIRGPGVEILSVYGEILNATSDAAAVSLHGVVADTAGQIYAGRFMPGSNLSFITIEVSVQEWIEDAEVMIAPRRQIGSNNEIA
ncbi:PCC domain-containing protein [Caballeronia sp. TF1N1]|uniref:PCC domain-containing protein n=1 Tax=Caballeronia sp. TF1N1 TaxID=2878153 RepID=UPI001FD2BC6D|nr:DUF296 domain-containing protein [Caballeronia sp. TF1N1]